MREWWEIAKQTWIEWNDDRAQRLGAALAFYSLFSIAPVLVLAVALAGSVYQEEAARQELATQLETLGPQVAPAILELTKNINQSEEGGVATVVSIVLLVVGATGALVGLKDALNTVWGVVDSGNSFWWEFLRDRLLSLALVVSVGVLLLGSVVLSTLLSSMTDAAARWLPLPFSLAVISNWVVSLTVITFLFALVFMILPDVRIGLKDVWVGAAVTSALFLVGRELIGLYLARVTVASTYGAAGSLVVMMIWVYYSAQIFLLGAEFTQVRACRRGAHIEPSRGACEMTEAKRQARAARNKRSKQR